MVLHGGNLRPALARLDLRNGVFHIIRIGDDHIRIRGNNLLGGNRNPAVLIRKDVRRANQLDHLVEERALAEGILIRSRTDFKIDRLLFLDALGERGNLIDLFVHCFHDSLRFGFLADHAADELDIFFHGGNRAAGRNINYADAQIEQRLIRVGSLRLAHAGDKDHVRLQRGNRFAVRRHHVKRRQTGDFFHLRRGIGVHRNQRTRFTQRIQNLGRARRKADNFFNFFRHRNRVSRAIHHRSFRAGTDGEHHRAQHKQNRHQLFHVCFSLILFICFSGIALLRGPRRIRRCANRSSGFGISAPPSQLFCPLAGQNRQWHIGTFFFPLQQRSLPETFTPFPRGIFPLLRTHRLSAHHYSIKPRIRHRTKPF